MMAIVPVQANTCPSTPAVCYPCRPPTGRRADASDPCQARCPVLVYFMDRSSKAAAKFNIKHLDGKFNDAVKSWRRYDLLNRA